MSRDAHLVAVSARTPVGLTAAGTAAAVRAGITRLREHPFMVDPAGERLRCAYDGVLDPALLGPERLAALAQHALRDVIGQLTRHGRYPAEVPVWLALPEPRPGATAADAGSIRRVLEAESPLGFGGRVRVREAGRGHAGALPALGLAVERIRSGEEDLCVIGGVDSYFDADTLDWLDAGVRLAREGVRGGFSPGEGASMVAVASDAARAALALPTLALVRAVACADEARNSMSDAGALGEGLGEAIARAGASLERGRELFDDVYCDINGERDRTDDWAFALLRTNTLFRDGTAYTMGAAHCGDLGAATVGVNCALAAQAWRRGYANGSTALVWGASWGGLRGAALLARSTA